MSLPLAIIGAGVAGLLAARTLQEAGLAVTVFEKSRGLGGRASTRRTEHGAFDHGAQYFTIRDPRFAALVQPAIEAGTIAPWEGRFGLWSRAGAIALLDDESRYVAVPGMSTLGRALGGSLVPVIFTKIVAIEGAPTHWSLRAEDGTLLGPYSQVLLTAPAPQTQALLDPIARELASQLSSVVLAPCLTLMITFQAPVDLPLDGVHVTESALAFAARNNSKPGRAPQECWVLHADPEFATSCFDAPESISESLMLAALQRMSASELPTIMEAHLHKWRYAQVIQALDQPCLYDPDLGLGAAGDWCIGPRLEAAAMSGLAVADRIIATL